MLLQSQRLLIKPQRPVHEILYNITTPYAMCLHIDKIILNNCWHRTGQ